MKTRCDSTMNIDSLEYLDKTLYYMYIYTSRINTLLVVLVTIVIL